LYVSEKEVWNFLPKYNLALNKTDLESISWQEYPWGITKIDIFDLSFNRPLGRGPFWNPYPKSPAGLWDLSSFLCPISVLYILHVWHLFLHAAGHWQWVSSVSSFQLPSRRHCSDQAQKRSQPLPLVAWHFWHLQHLWPLADTHGWATPPSSRPPPFSTETTRINGLQFRSSLRQFVSQSASFDQLIREQS